MKTILDRIFQTPRAVILFIFWTGFVLDSGGGLGLRIFSGAICAIVALRQITLNRNPRMWRIIYPRDIAIFVIWPILCVIFALTKNITFVNSFKWITGLIATIPFALVADYYGSDLSKSFARFMSVFAIFIIVLHILILFKVDFALDIFNFLAGNVPGYFQEKRYEDGSVAPQVYFQTTLLLVPAGILLQRQNKLFSALVCLLALALAASRTGMIVLACFLMLNTKNAKTFFSIAILGSVLTIAVIYLFGLPILNNLQFLWGEDSSGLSIRQDHLNSIMAGWVKSPIEMIIGAGPGSIFYSLGFNYITDNIEVTQLEIARKYGIPYALIFCSYYLFHCLISYRSENNKEQGLGIALLAYFLVAFSNPVLFSLSAMLLFARVLSRNNSNMRLKWLPIRSHEFAKLT